MGQGMQVPGPLNPLLLKWVDRSWRLWALFFNHWVSPRVGPGLGTGESKQNSPSATGLMVYW